ncbi:hypothetical protein KCP70_01870 [Salmonella enterica subsp. enterica]|nr:hypothetical protein KCP70_01870 [Salmonella enterica subsp. enterica]
MMLRRSRLQSDLRKEGRGVSALPGYRVVLFLNGLICHERNAAKMMRRRLH